MDHINVKIFATPDSTVNWHDLIPVFHRWIRDNEIPGTPVDVTDYSHVPNGPGVLLIAHDAFFSVDNRAGQLGFLYNRRTPLEGDLAGKVREAYDSALTAARKLEKEVPSLRFDATRFELFVNDRALAPNNEETDRAVRPVVEAVYAEKVGKPAQIAVGATDPRSLYRLEVTPAA
jgi:hypothetical protein